MTKRPLYVAATIVGALTEGSGLGLLLPLFDSLNTGHTRIVLGNFNVETNTQTLVVLLCVMVALRSALLVLTHFLKSRLVNDWSHHIRVALYRSAHSDKLTPLQKAKTGTAMNIVLGETWHSSEYRKTELDLVARVVSVVIFGSGLLWVSWRLTLLLAVSFLVPVLVVGVGASLRTQRYGREIVKQENDIHDETLASLNGRFEIKTYGLEQFFEDKFRGYSDLLRTTTTKADVAGSVVPQVQQLFLLPALILALFVGRRIGVPLERVALFVVFVSRTMPHAAGIVGALGQLGRHRGGHEMVRDHLGSGSEVESGSNGLIDIRRSEVEPIETIELVNIGFTYPDTDSPTLSGVSAFLEAGRVYDISGPSGSGKSTLIATILGLLQPSVGWVLVNGRRLGLGDIGAFRDQVGYAGQRGTLFEGSVRSNILLGRSVDDGRMKAIEDAVGLSSVFAGLPEQAETFVGRGGVEISGGERQRVLLARAILAEPKVLILDEATSELDQAAEVSVLAAVDELCPNAIKIVVSHHNGDTLQPRDKATSSIEISESGAAPRSYSASIIG